MTLQMEGTDTYSQSEEKEWKDDFVSDELCLGWYRKSECTPRSIATKTYITVDTTVRKDSSSTARPGYLTLHSGPYTLSLPTSPTLFLRKQKHWPVVWETEVDFQPKISRVEAGTTVWWNYTCFASIGIRSPGLGDDKRRIVRFTPPANAGENKDQETSEEGSVKFIIDCTPTSYRLGFRERQTQNNDQWTWLGEVDTQVLTRNPEIGQPFTGMMMGLYSFG